LRAVECSADLRTVLDECARLWRETDGFFDAFASGRLDPSGYVKGWSVEVASARLAAAGSVNHCINAGGDVRARGSPAPGEPWRIGIRHPVARGSVVRVVIGRDVAVATSGTYEKGSHISDPHTGEPVQDLVSLTVVGPGILEADVQATAAFAMGPHALAYLETLPGYEGYAIGPDLRATWTSGFDAWCG
jgi:thiamine biosynthesis lipoprotein